MDDILLIGNDIEFLDSIKGYLNKNKLEQGIFVFLGLIDLKIKAKENRSQMQII